LFVANLPFTLEDESFGKVLKDSNLTFKVAKVVRNTRTGRSKGFGFIEFENEADQQKALAGLNKKQIEGREISVKVALTELKTEEQPQQPKA
jgi:RNA recognition motif-containing protein